MAIGGTVPVTTSGGGAKPAIALDPPKQREGLVFFLEEGTNYGMLVTPDTISLHGIPVPHKGLIPNTLQIGTKVRERHGAKTIWKVVDIEHVLGGPASRSFTYIYCKRFIDPTANDKLPGKV